MPKQVQMFKLESSLGEIFAAVSGEGVLVVTIPDHGEPEFLASVARRAPKAEAEWVEAETTHAGRQLAAYLKGYNPELDAPLDWRGLTGFQRAVMERVRAIPYGQTRSYGEIAAQAGSPKAARAVGQVMHRNPVPLFVPCHRVLGANGSLTGFGSGLDTKKTLLAMEANGGCLG